MGRELRRVPLDFDWPMNQRWSGFVNPHYAKCQRCDGRGDTMAMARLSDLVSLLMLSGDDARRGKCHPYFIEAPLYSSAGKVCGPEMAELTVGLAGRKSDSGFGHDAIDRWGATKKIVAAAGLPESWGTCPDCDGEGIPKENLAAYEAWSRTDPPSGDGYQLWETVSEGSPISPIFAKPDELARWLADNPWSSVDHGTTYEQWLAFINGPGWAPSMVVTDGVVQSGVQAASHAAGERK